jgi:hypothetical protein
MPVKMIPETGGPAVDVPDDAVSIFAERGYTLQTNEARAAEVVESAREEYYTTPDQLVTAGLAGVARGFTGGLSDVAARALGGREQLEGLREHNPITSTVTEIGGAVSSLGVGGLAGRVGAKIAGVGGGAAKQIARSAAKAGTEGAIVGAGQGVSELALSSDPLTLERAASVIGSNALFGAVTGGAVGAVGKGVERTLVRAKSALDDVAAKGIGKAGLADDVSKLDAKGLRAAQKTEMEAVEAARIPRRADLADELKSFRKELKEQKVWLAAKGVDDAEIKASAIGKRTLKADKQLDNLLDDPRALAENPKAALSSLRKQEAALDDLVNKHGDKLRASFADDVSGTRAKALDNAAVALERNRSLQTKIAELSGKPASKKLEQIAEAMEQISSGTQQPSAGGIAGDMLKGSIFGHVAGAFSGLPIVGPMIGAKAASLAGKLVSGKMGAASAEVAKRGSKAVGAFLSVADKLSPLTRAAPVIATKVLSSVTYAEPKKQPKGSKPSKETTLASSYKARASEIQSQVAAGLDGTLQMRPSARAKMAARLAPVAAVNPLLADRMETIAARRLEFLASKLPKRPDVAGIPTGPDRWQPSDMEMRKFARFAAAVEDPYAIVERLTDGSITPEDGETMRKVYPEIFADIQRQIVEALPRLRETLPYQRRLAMSLFSGVPVDPVLDPAILSRIQASYASEEGTEGGQMAPRAEPAFGSVTKEEPTSAQSRSA